MRLRTVFFDLGGTLIDERDYPRWVDVAAELGLTLDENHLAHAYREVQREQDVPHPPTLAATWAEVLSRASATTVDRPLVERFMARFLQEPSPPRLYSDARRCLTQLHQQGRRMAIISNSRSEASVAGILATTGIGEFFEEVISSGTEGVAKPESAIFWRALERMHALPTESLHVGDLAYRDAKAAQLAGLSGVWLNREGSGFGEDPPEITSLTELPFYLEALEGARVK